MTRSENGGILFLIAVIRGIAEALTQRITSRRDRISSTGLER
jgi:hypothetical protein